MDWYKIRRWSLVVLVAACSPWARGQSAATSGSEVAPDDANGGTRPQLTLSVPALRSTMDKVNLAWLFSEKLPDFRLKLEHPELEALSLTNMDSRIRGVEIRLPLEGLWVGYELPTDNEEPRATFSIQRGF